MSTHYVKALQTVSLFNGALKLSLDDRVALTEVQFTSDEVQTAITAGKLVELTSEQAAIFKGSFTVIRGDKQLTKNQNVSVDTSLGIVNLTLYPNPKVGYSHYFLPVDATWGASDPTFPARLHSDTPIMGDTEYYDLDYPTPVYALYVGGSIGWQIIPS